MHLHLCPSITPPRLLFPLFIKIFTKRHHQICHPQASAGLDTAADVANWQRGIVENLVGSPTVVDQNSEGQDNSEEQNSAQVAQER